MIKQDWQILTVLIVIILIAAFSFYIILDKKSNIYEGPIVTDFFQNSSKSVSFYGNQAQVVLQTPLGKQNLSANPGVFLHPQDNPGGFNIVSLNAAGAPIQLQFGLNYSAFVRTNYTINASSFSISDANNVDVNCSAIGVAFGQGNLSILPTNFSNEIKGKAIQGSRENNTFYELDGSGQHFQGSINLLPGALGVEAVLQTNQTHPETLKISINGSSRDITDQFIGIFSMSSFSMNFLFTGAIDIPYTFVRSIAVSSTFPPFPDLFINEDYIYTSSSIGTMNGSLGNYELKTKGQMTIYNEPGNDPDVTAFGIYTNNASMLLNGKPFLKVSTYRYLDIRQIASLTAGAALGAIISLIVSVTTEKKRHPTTKK